MTNFERITRDMDSLVEYLLRTCSSVIHERGKDECSFCEVAETEERCTHEHCVDSVKKFLKERGEEEGGSGKNCSNFEKITRNVDALAEYLFEGCDNPMCEHDEDVCEGCEMYTTKELCDNEHCLDSIKRFLSEPSGEADI